MATEQKDIDLDALRARFVAAVRGRGSPNLFRILDAGCEPRRDTPWFSGHGFQVVGVAPSDGVLDDASHRGPEVASRQSKLRHLDFPAGSFDGVWCGASLVYLARAEVPGVLRELRRLLGHGFLSLAVTVGQSGGRDADLHSPVEPHRISEFQRQEIELYLERAGFEVVEAVEQSTGGEHQWIQILARATLVTPIVGAVAVVFDDTGRVLLSEPVDGRGWCMPGGALEAMETPEDAVVREVREETGLEVAIDRFVGLYMHPTYRGADRMLILHAFDCHVVGGALTPTAEAPRHGWFDRTALPEPLLRRLEADIQGDMIRDAWARRTGPATDVARRRYA